MTNKLDAAARREAYREMQFRHGDDPHYWDYAQWIAEMLEQALEHVEGLVGPEAAAGPLRQLVEPVAIVDRPRAETWRDVLDDVFSAGTVWPISERLNEALMYGLYGVTPKELPVAQRRDWIDDLVSEVSTFAERSDIAVLGAGDNAIVKIANLAKSRHALDTGNGELDLHSMAVLGAVSEGRVRNLLSGTSGKLERGAGGGVVAMSALAWLQKREDFMDSIWSVEESSDEEDEEGPELDPKRLSFVPVARDGSTFNPSLARSGVYKIGAKGHEQDFSSFENALAALNTMPVPRWRRPNDKGHWGIVSGVAWQRIER